VDQSGLTRTLLSRSFTAGHVAPLRHTVAGHAESAGLTDERCQDFVLAVDEVITNAVRHGGGGGHLDVWVTEDVVWFRVSDTGPGINVALPTRPPEPTEPGGRGLWIARQLTDQMMITTGRGGTTVTGGVGLPNPREHDRRAAGYEHGMRSIDLLLDEVYAGHERMTRDEIHRRAVAADLPAGAISVLDALPEGEYTQDEAASALALLRDEPDVGAGPQPEEGVPAAELSDDDLDRELTQLHRTREDTFRHGSPQALDRHTSRMAEMEAEYVRRFPEREIDVERLRSGARQRERDDDATT
jgi:anti-sigma regulatory factor (Ser/Thr protein kinase)